jgi:hypothetical protein
MARYVQMLVNGGTPVSNPKNTFLVRDVILNLLSEEELERVSLAEARTLADGEYFVDLQHPEKGVLKVGVDKRPRSSDVLPQSAVRDETWIAIIRQIGR